MTRIIFLIFFSILPNLALCANMGQFTLTLRDLSILTNASARKNNIPIGSTISQIDKSLFSNHPEEYHQRCENILYGPKILSLNTPIKYKNITLVGFTEEVKLQPSANDNNKSPGKGRYIFFWEGDIFRIQLRKSESFNTYAKTRKINFADTSEFDFPELRKLVASGPPKRQIPPRSAAPPTEHLLLPSDPTEPQKKNHKPNDQQKLNYPSFFWIIISGASIIAAAVTLHLLRSRKMQH